MPQQAHRLQAAVAVNAANREDADGRRARQATKTSVGLGGDDGIAGGVPQTL